MPYNGWKLIFTNYVKNYSPGKTTNKDVYFTIDFCGFLATRRGGDGDGGCFYSEAALVVIHYFL